MHHLGDVFMAAAGKVLFKDRVVAELPLPARGQREVFDARVRGFGVRLAAGGTRTYFVAYRFGEKPRRLTIGRSTEISAEKARREAEEARGLIRRGIDPAAERRASSSVTSESSGTPQTQTIAALVDLYFEKKVLPDELRSSTEMRRMFDRHVVSRWGVKDVLQIDRSQIVKLLDELRAAGSPVQANRVLASLRTMFRWALGRGLVEGNPCDGIEKPTKERARDRVLNDEEVGAIWKASASLSLPYQAFARFLILCGQRKRETANAVWAEFNVERAVWTIPGRRTKNGKTHDVPLSDAMVQILKSLPRTENDAQRPVFSTNGEVPINEFVRTKLKLDLISGVRDWTLHDLRRTMASGMARLQAPPHVIEKILNHTPQSISGVAAVYNRHGYDEEKRQALEAWSKQVAAVVNKQAQPFLKVVSA